MKIVISNLIVVVLILVTFAGCFQKTVSSQSPNAPTESTAKATGEEAAMTLLASLMTLDYSAMTVSEFNETVVTICADDADTTIFQLISDVYDSHAVYSDSGEFIATAFQDPAVEQFVQTLEYSGQEILGEPVSLGSVMYLTLPNMTAAEVAEKRDQMQPNEWEQFFDDNIADIGIYPILSYVIEWDIPDSASIFVSARDGSINDIHRSIKEFVLGLDAQAILAETLENEISAELERISDLYSNEKMTVKSSIQSLERDLH